MRFFKKNGFADDKLLVTNKDLIILNNNIKVRPIPGAHTTIEKTIKIVIDI